MTMLTLLWGILLIAGFCYFAVTSGQQYHHEYSMAMEDDEVLAELIRITIEEANVLSAIGVNGCLFVCFLLWWLSCLPVAVLRMIWSSLIDTISGKYGTQAISGPVGVIGEIKETAQYGFSSLMFLTMVLTMNIGLFNLLPFPALDGGRIFFLLIEIVRRKPVNPKYEGYVHLAGLALLFALMIFVTANDIAKIFN